MTLRKRTLYITLLLVLLLIIGGLAAFALTRPEEPPRDYISQPNQGNPTPQPTEQPNEEYEGEKIDITSHVSIKVPNGWSATLSHDPTFTALMFARTDELTSLDYDADADTTITNSGISLSSGLAEHFFILVPTASQRFSETQHREVSSESFTFDDGHKGIKYYVVKHEAEAQQWGGLQKDSEWQGRTYIYEKGDTRVEAHLAKYPSTNIDINFFEKVVKTLGIRD